MRPIWKQADLLKMHAGQTNWSEQIVKDPEQDATYNSAAPGTKFPVRMHPDTPTLFVVVAGQIHFEVEGQQPITATRGALVNIMHTTLYSYDVTGDRNALWVEVNPPNYQMVYPSSSPQPAAAAGAEMVKVSFNHTPGAYTGNNKLMVNTFDDVIGKCLPRGAVVVDDHLWASPLIGYLNAADNKCGTGTGNVGDGGAAGGVQSGLDLRPFPSRAGGMVGDPVRRDQRQIREHRRISCGGGRCALCRADDLAPDGIGSAVRPFHPPGTGRI